ncbi:Intradiol ring-cleavage dioxygenase [Plectosphaerella plurivora]|uniref:Intradiol ring-cleavage dioxygenase n=1 Tax=Plectosphaerella plurivora TaxID=936078 RepID=A0A9P9AA37_9PEZI|nr:Intradiol ring-cleavage dioxygenase [Plectosphaerella plurivora]
MRTSAAWLLFAAIAAAHPGHDVSEELAERKAFLGSVKRASLGHCAEKLKARGIEERNSRRRAALVDAVRERRGLKKRDFETVLNTDHNKTDLGYTVNTAADELFRGKNSCVLTPEVTQGPYYVGGEYVRRDITEDEKGVPLTIDYQVIDVDTCEPVSAYLEIWHCNALGVYSGVVAAGNGDSSDDSNLDATWLRGIQKTDDDGVAQFDTIVPGHYTGRAVHIHLMVHTNATEFENKTLGNEIYASHIGQAFFDQELINAVELTSTYSDNQQSLTLNENDSIFEQEAATDGVDPVMEYTMLGDNIEDGLFAWLAFGVNKTDSQKISPAVFLYEGGGVENEDSGMGGGGGGGPGGRPPGASGSANAGTATETSSSPSSTQSGNSGSGSREGSIWQAGVAVVVLQLVGNVL